MKNQNQLKQGSARSIVTSRSKNPHCILMCRFTTNNLRFDAQFLKMSAFSKKLGFKHVVQLEFDCLPIRTLPDQSKKSFLQMFIEDNPIFDSIIFPKVSQLLKHKGDLNNNVHWFRKNEVHIFFHDENIQMFDSEFNVTAEFQSFLN